LKQFKKKIKKAGECLGAVCRRRTCQATIRCGEWQAHFDPQISEWGNPAGVMSRHRVSGGHEGN